MAATRHRGTRRTTRTVAGLTAAVAWLGVVGWTWSTGSWVGVVGRRGATQVRLDVFDGRARAWLLDDEQMAGQADGVFFERHPTRYSGLSVESMWRQAASIMVDVPPGQTFRVAAARFPPPRVSWR